MENNTHKNTFSRVINSSIYQGYGNDRDDKVYKTSLRLESAWNEP